MKNEDKEESEGERGEESAAGQWSTDAVMTVTSFFFVGFFFCAFYVISLGNLYFNPEESFDMGHTQGDGEDYRRRGELELVEANVTTAAAAALASAASKAKVKVKPFE